MSVAPPDRRRLPSRYLVVMTVERPVAVSAETVVMAMIVAMIVVMPVLVTGALALGLTRPRLGAARPAEQ